MPNTDILELPESTPIEEESLSEADAMRVLTEARRERENQCVEEVNAVLAKHNCQLLAVFSVGNQNIPIGKLVNLPSQVLIASK